MKRLAGELLAWQMKGLSAAWHSGRPGVLCEALHGTVAQPSLLGDGLLQLLPLLPRLLHHGYCCHDDHWYVENTIVNSIYHD